MAMEVRASFSETTAVAVRFARLGTSRTCLGSTSVTALMLSASGWRVTATFNAGRFAPRSEAEADGPQPFTCSAGFELTVAPFWPVKLTSAFRERKLVARAPLKQRSFLDSSGPFAPPFSVSSNVLTGRSGTSVTVDLISLPPRIEVAMLILTRTRPRRSATSAGRITPGCWTRYTGPESGVATNEDVALAVPACEPGGQASAAS
jgi:hypothetical protein